MLPTARFLLLPLTLLCKLTTNLCPEHPLDHQRLQNLLHHILQKTLEAALGPSCSSKSHSCFNLPTQFLHRRFVCHTSSFNEGGGERPLRPPLNPTSIHAPSRTHNRSSEREDSLHLLGSPRDQEDAFFRFPRILSLIINQRPENSVQNSVLILQKTSSANIQTINNQCCHFFLPNVPTMLMLRCFCLPEILQTSLNRLNPIVSWLERYVALMAAGSKIN
ncbi:hypothetical protein PCASD_26696 [Puccinia coronata f. sp. avenae]|uniref:Secreted protein n=1 Tax=Puccinia coronata f. sp. avenae TaxID=200324 RepID=A0A2N5RU61_9BASI|nr:hypothetical protein PCASD_26696 [Puccinia coronata f. sp. avenae]